MNKPLRYCKYPNCTNLVSSGYCAIHAKPHTTGKHNAMYNSKWKKARATFLIAHPLCVVCKGIATDVDHIKPHRGDYILFWDKSNWQALCHSCHSKKTVQEDGGFGKPSL